MASKNRGRFVTTLLSAFLLASVLSGSLIYLAHKIEAVDEDIERLRSSIFDEVESQYSALQSLHSSTLLISEDMKEMRDLLGLNAEDYGVEEDLLSRRSGNRTGEAGASSGKDSHADSEERAYAEDETLFFKAVDRIEQAEERRRVKRSIAELFDEGGPLARRLQSTALRMEKRGDMRWELVAEDITTPVSEYDPQSPANPVYTIRAARKSPEAYRMTIHPPVGTALSTTLPLGTYRFSEDSRRDIGEFIEKRHQQLQTRNERLREMIERVEAEISSASFRSLRNERNLHLSSGQAEGEKLWWNLRHRNSGDGFRFGVDTASAEYLLGDQRHEHMDSFRSGLHRMTEGLDSRSSTERSIDRAIARIEQISEDEAFRAYLKKRDLRLNTEAREGNDLIYFDLLRSDGSRFGSFAVQKHSGKIYIVDSDEVIISSFSSLENRSSFTIRKP